MRWFTRDWHSGDQQKTDEAPEEAYARHVSEIAPMLPAPLRMLAAGTQLNLHDGRITHWSWEPGESLKIQIECGDLQAGHQRATLEYAGSVEVSGADADTVATWLGGSDTELLYDEIDLLAPGRYEHRHLLWPQGEFAVRFDEAAVLQEPSTPAAYTAARRPPTQT
jgi:hypothetical protein